MFENKKINYIGVDVSKKKLDVFFSENSKHIVLQNNAEKIEKAFKRIDTSNSFVVLENTGGYERACLDTLIRMGFSIHRTNNGKFNSFKKSDGVKAKSDKIDAKKLADYGEEKHGKLRIYVPVTDCAQKLKEMVLYLDDLKKIRAGEKNRNKSGGYAFIQENTALTIAKLTECINELKKNIELSYENDDYINSKMNLLMSYKGIGQETALKLIATLPELGKVDKKIIASIAGLAPIINQSGDMNGYRTTKGNGRPFVKRALFMAALSAIKYNDEIYTYYNRLVSSGKKKMVAIVACMRKMIVQLNAIVMDFESKNTIISLI